MCIDNFVICYCKKYTDKPQRLTLDKWNEMIDSPRVKNLVTAYRNGDADAKKDLPAVMWHASFNGKRRAIENAIPSGLYMLDIDHLEVDPRALVSERVMPHIDDCGILVIHVTPSGKGLRIVARMLRSNGFATIAEHQSWLAAKLGLKEYDAVTKDLARMSFVVTRDDVIYFDEKLFTTAPEFVVDNPMLVRDDGQVVATTISTTPTMMKKQYIDDKTAQNEMNVPVATSSPTPSPTAGQTHYRGVPLTDIAQTLIKQMFSDGVCEGNRNSRLFRVACLMRYITDFNAQVIAQSLPDYGLPQAEVLSLCQSSLAQSRKQWMPKEVKRALAAFGLDESEGDADDDMVDDGMVTAAEGEVSGEEEYFAQLCSPQHYADHLPEMPPLFNLFVNNISTKFKAAQALAMLPIVGAIATRIRSKYGIHDNTPSFTTIVYAPQSSGKGLMGITFNRLTREMVKADRVADEAIRAYKREREKDPTTKRPNAYIRIVPPTSLANLMEYNEYAKGLHLLSYTPEIDAYTSTKKRGTWADPSSYDRIAFDNDYFEQSFARTVEHATRVRIYHNKLLCGTPKAVDRYITNYEDGTPSRIIFVPIHVEIGEPRPTFVPFAPEEDKQIDLLVSRLMCDATRYDLGYLITALEAYKESMRLEAIRRQDAALNAFYDRPAIIGFRAGMVAAACYKADGQTLDDERVRQSIVNFALWVTHFALASLMERYAPQVDKDELEATTERPRRMGKFIKLLDALPDEFTHNDVEKKRFEMGIGSRTSVIIHRWRERHLIRKVARKKDTYKKVAGA